jgi:acyl-CoA reductase-like NAD-dependent aldehyde dehydrogenase
MNAKLLFVVVLALWCVSASRGADGIDPQGDALTAFQVQYRAAPLVERVQMLARLHELTRQYNEELAQILKPSIEPLTLAVSNLTVRVDALAGTVYGRIAAENLEKKTKTLGEIRDIWNAAKARAEREGQ